MALAAAILWIFLGIVVLCKEGLKEDANLFCAVIVAMLILVAPFSIMTLAYMSNNTLLLVISVILCPTFYIVLPKLVDLYDKYILSKATMAEEQEDKEIWEYIDQLEVTQEELERVKWRYGWIHMDSIALITWRQEKFNKEKAARRRARLEHIDFDDRYLD